MTTRKEDTPFLPPSHAFGSKRIGAFYKTKCVGMHHFKQAFSAQKENLHTQSNMESNGNHFVVRVGKQYGEGGFVFSIVFLFAARNKKIPSLFFFSLFLVHSKMYNLEKKNETETHMGLGL